MSGYAFVAIIAILFAATVCLDRFLEHREIMAGKRDPSVGEDEEGDVV